MAERIYEGDQVKIDKDKIRFGILHGLLDQAKSGKKKAPFVNFTCRDKLIIDGEVDMKSLINSIAEKLENK